MRTAFLLIIWFGGLLTASAAGIREGMSRAEVESALGKPLSVLVQGDLTILNYPERGRVELTADAVTRVLRVRHVDDPPTPEELAAEAATKLETEIPAQEEAAAAAAAREAEAHEAAEIAAAKSATDAEARLEASLAELAAVQERDGEASLAGDFGLAAEPSEFWIGLGIGLLVQIVVGMLVLKLAFTWTAVHADWGQMFLPALAAAASGALVRAGAFALWRTDQLFHLDYALSFAALLFTLMKTTHACTFARAAGVAMATQLMWIVVWTFLGVALMQVLFGRWSTPVLGVLPCGWKLPRCGAPPFWHKLDESARRRG